MAENINISFAPNKSASESQRIADLEQYVSTLTERTKFAFASIIEEYNGADTDKTQQILNTIYQSTSESGSDVGQFTNTDKNCEIFNDYENNTASSYYAHAEGYKTKATAPYSHAEGRETVAYNMHSHAEGYKTVAGGQSSHAEGEDCRATGSYSHAEGHKTVASGTSSHASGWGTVAGDMTFAIGRWNKTSDGLFVVGNGWNSGSDESDASRSDALVLDGSGNLRIAGKLTADGGVEYSMPTATRYTLGGVVIGDNISVTADGIISVDLSEYLKSGDISDWAKADNKPTYTASEIGLGNVDNTADADKPISTATQKALDGKADTGHTHTVSDITDMPAYLTEETDPTVPDWAKADTKPTYTASEVGAATAADITAAVNAVEIGGRNLLYDSTGNLKKGWNANVTITENGGISGNSLAVSRSGYSGNARYFGMSKRHFLTDFDVGTSYTLSAWIKVRSDVELDASGYVMARFRDSANGLYVIALQVKTTTEKDKWIFYKRSWTINVEVTKLEAVALTLDKNGMIEACNIKLEKGTKATDWSPAPEDTTDEITSLSSKQSSLEQTVDGFKTTVESTYATKSSLSGYPTITQMNSAINQKTDSITTTVSKQIAEIAVGGRNIITGSAKLTIGAGKRPKGHWRQSGPVTLASTSASGVPYADDLTACVLTATTINASGGLVQDGVPLSKDEYYTLSCWVKNTSAKSVKFILQPFWKSSSDFDRKVFILNESAEWQRISYTSSKKPKTSDVYGAGAVLLNADTVGASIQVCGVKLEKGNKPTDWTPAPEDDEWKIASLEARVAALEAMAVSGGEV